MIETWQLFLSKPITVIGLTTVLLGLVWAFTKYDEKVLNWLGGRSCLVQVLLGVPLLVIFLIIWGCVPGLMAVLFYVGGPIVLLLFLLLSVWDRVRGKDK